MRISLSNAGKRFNREWIFRGVTLEFVSPKKYAITGPNGSGKSTLLQVLGGMMQASEGSVEYAVGSTQYAVAETSEYEVGEQKPEDRGQESESSNQKLNEEDVHKRLSFCAPYMEVIEEMTLIEFLDFHQQFKPLLPAFSTKKIIEAIGLQSAAGKQIRYYSSGMKQRVKLAQAIFSSTAIVLLDEPCGNLDAKGIELYHTLISNHCVERLVIVSSNDKTEYSFCDEVISILDYKSPPTS